MSLTSTPYLADPGDPGEDGLAAVDVLDGALAEEKVDVLAVREGTHEVGRVQLAGVVLLRAQGLPVSGDCIQYRVANLVANLGWVDLNFDYSTVCLILPGLMGVWQKRLGSWARWWNSQIQVNRTQVCDQMGHPVEYRDFFIRHERAD